MNKLFIDNEKIILNNKNILLRVDYNVPINDNKITDTNRIDNTFETINFLFDNKKVNNIIILSHLGRPKGKINYDYTLKPVYEYLKTKLSNKVFFNTLYDSFDFNKNNNHSILLLENIRFYPEEENKGSEEKINLFRKDLKKLADVFVNDAFGTCHRNHCSIMGYGYDYKLGGLLIKKELNELNKILSVPLRPFTCILGGAKVSDKIKLIYNMLDKVDNILIGGGMAFTFLKIKHNYNIGKSLYDKDSEEEVKKILKKAEENNVNIVLPVDFLTAKEVSNDTEFNYRTINDSISDDYMGLDVGMKTTIMFEKIIYKSKKILWNGPMGVFELDNFSKGSKMISLSVQSFAETNIESNVVIGGGDTVSCIKKFTHNSINMFFSTGGGSTLKYLEGTKLPGIENLSNQ